MASTHVIHYRNGRIGAGTDTTAEHLDAIIRALKDDPERHLILYFHGGLVNKKSGLALAERLGKQFQPLGTSAFYVWESGFLETLRNNFLELFDEPVFKELVRKLLEYALQSLGGGSGGRSVVAAQVDASDVRQTVNELWTTGQIPYRDFRPSIEPDDKSKATARAASMTLREDDIQADLEGDADFAAALATLPSSTDRTRSAFGARGAVVRDTPFAQALSDEVSTAGDARGIIDWMAIAVFVAKLLKRVITRYMQGRDHGLYATVVEEIVRAIGIQGASLNELAKALEWNRMKKDTADAFGDEANRAGSALLTRIADAIKRGEGPRRITLVGHSTGAIYIARWLADADKRLPPEIKADVVFLAPAITYELFDETLTKYGSRIGKFRSFAMRDELERVDQVWGDDPDLVEGKDLRRFVYPSSLLYLVSGVLEYRQGADEADVPLVGLERHFSLADTYKGDSFQDVERVRAWLKADPSRLVWSKTEGNPAGLNSLSIDHGAFDDEPLTVASVLAILGNG